jgi:hypothetical protein
MSRCEEVTKDIAAGKCGRTAEGKVVLLSRAFLPRDLPLLPGATMAKCIVEWHKHNPNQLAVGMLLSSTTAGTFLYSVCAHHCYYRVSPMRTDPLMENVGVHRQPRGI